MIATAGLLSLFVCLFTDGFLFSSLLHFKENKKSYEGGRDAYLIFGKSLSWL